MCGREYSIRLIAMNIFSVEFVDGGGVVMLVRKKDPFEQFEDLKLTH